MPEDGPAAAGFAIAVGRVKRLMALCAGALTPVLAGFAGIAPPWPRGATKLSVVLLTLVLALSWQRVSTASPKRRQRLLVAATTVCLLSLCGYFVLVSQFVYQIPTNAGAVIVLGCGYNENGRAVASYYHLDTGFGCPGDFERLLTSAQFEAGEIWIRWSITGVEIALFASWLLTLSALSIGLLTFAANELTLQTQPGRQRAGQEEKPLE